MKLTIETERETDGRWIPEIPEFPGVVAYAATLAEAIWKAETLALSVVAEQRERGPNAF
jgi:predicted RNase H-like HicB family nuclease